MTAEFEHIALARKWRIKKKKTFKEATQVSQQRSFTEACLLLFQYLLYLLTLQGHKMNGIYVARTNLICGTKKNCDPPTMIKPTISQISIFKISK